MLLLGQSQWEFHKASWTLNTLTWHCIDKERDDESFMGVERVSWGWNSSALFSKYGRVGNWTMKPHWEWPYGVLPIYPLWVSKKKSYPIWRFSACELHDLIFSRSPFIRCFFIAIATTARPWCYSARATFLLSTPTLHSSMPRQIICLIQMERASGLV